MSISLIGLQSQIVQDWNALVEFIEENTSTVGRQEVAIEDVEQLERLLKELREEICVVASLIDPKNGECLRRDEAIEILHWSVNPE